MGAFINAKNGYGWSVVTPANQIDADENGTYLIADPAEAISKTIYVDVDDGQAPIYIAKAFRLYTDDTGGVTADVATTGLDVNIDIEVTVPDESFVDLYVKGFATTDVLITFDAVSVGDEVRIYKFNEAGI